MIKKSISYLIVTSVILTAVMLTVCGCVKEIEGGINDDEYIAFTAAMSEERTKATPMTRLKGDAGIIGYVYDQWPAGDVMKNFAPWSTLDKEVFTFDGYMLTSGTDKLIKWSEAEDTDKSKLKVFAYTPVSDDNMTVSYGTAGNHTIPAITYTVPTDITQQKDIVTASAEVSTSFRKNIPLTFDHILTGLKFKAGFDCTVKAITISNVISSGKYTIGEGWSGLSGTQNYTVNLNKEVKAGDMITAEEDNTVLFMIPQSFGSTSTASITLTYDDDKTITTSLKDIEWEEGRMITYTLHKQENAPSEYIYFDLAAGDVTIDGINYNGKIYVGGIAKDVTGPHSDENRYYVYQSSELKTEFNKNNTGYASETDFNAKTDCRIPEYKPVTYQGMLWSDWITNNTCVEDVIEIWDNGANIREDGLPAPEERYTDIAVVRDAGREHTRNFIKVTGQGKKYNLTIDDIYSVIQVPVNKTNQTFRKRSVGGIAYIPEGNTELSVNFVGDNRMGCLHIDNSRTDKIILEGTGSLTVADTDFITVSSEPGYANDFGDSQGYISNFWNSAIGNNTDDGSGENVYNLYIKSGTVFAGATKAEDCTAIGGGGNGFGQIYITGGNITAVATTAGTAIGGGMGHTANGGPGEVHISGGNVYAYNLKNKWGIPSSAIGGGGSMGQVGSDGTVNISGGYVYSYSALGTGIGGGSSTTLKGGNATINITGGYIIAKSDNRNANGIGGGTGGSSLGANGGTAKVTISGSSIIRTGSIGGGKTNNTDGHIGSADIDISGGDIQAQFVMAAGAGVAPSFTMSGGLIRNSDTEDQEYYHVQPNGGAVYLEDGNFTMTGGEIRQCLAEKGGAIYIKGTASTTFSMTGGTITQCTSETDGGALYLEGGKVSISGGVVSHNLANNGNGGGFCIVGGNFSMPEGGDARIFENATFSQSNKGGNGGGLYVTSAGSDVTVDILSGTIMDNSSDRVGGGICVDMTGHESSSATVTVGKAGGDNLNPSISSNHTIILGGGLYAKGEKANIIINSGRITGNTISGYVSNPDVANEGGMVTLNGGDVTHVTVTYNNNGEYVNHEVETAVQKIVTSTNSTMVAPTFEILGYKFTGWNTRPDGKGTIYTDGQTMNLKNNLTLYAQWRRN